VFYGSYRIQQYHEEEQSGWSGRTIEVTAVQPNIPLPKTNSQPQINTLDLLLRMSIRVLKDHPDIDLVVWPETPKSLECLRRSTSRRRVGKIVSEYGVPFLINCIRRTPFGGNYNTALLIDGINDMSFYNKHKLFPFAENIPLEESFPMLRKLAPSAGNYIPGNNINTFTLSDGWRAAPSICYEIMFSDHVRKMVAHGGEVLLNQTNDAWFGQSSIADFMVASSILQSIAYRIPLVRVSNSGNSLFLKASGELSPGTRTQNTVTTTITSSVFIPAKRSPYAAIGNLFLYLLTLITGVNLWRGKKGSLQNECK
jgi:apolipoprotein N-acyltransferase